jgi:hypothetical protein
MSNLTPTPAEYWKRKLSAYLHDSPDKVLDIADHERRARTLAQAEGFETTETARISAWRFWQNWASSADERFACLPAESHRMSTDVLLEPVFTVLCQPAPRHR